MQAFRLGCFLAGFVGQANKQSKRLIVMSQLDRVWARFNWAQVHSLVRDNYYYWCGTTTIASNKACYLLFETGPLLPETGSL